MAINLRFMNHLKVMSLKWIVYLNCHGLFLSGPVKPNPNPMKYKCLRSITNCHLLKQKCSVYSDQQFYLRYGWSMYDVCMLLVSWSVLVPRTHNHCYVIWALCQRFKMGPMTQSTRESDGKDWYGCIRWRKDLRTKIYNFIPTFWFL